MTSQKLHEEHEILRRFMAVVVSSASWDSLINPTPATCHKRKRKLRCSFWNAALQKLHCNIGFSAVRKSFGPKAALQQTKNCTATSKKLRCRKVALSCRFPAGFKPPRLGTHVSDLLKVAETKDNAQEQKKLKGCAHVGSSKVWRNTGAGFTTPCNSLVVLALRARLDEKKKIKQKKKKKKKKKKFRKIRRRTKKKTKANPKQKKTKEKERTKIENDKTIEHIKFIWIQEGFTAEPPRNDSGANFQ